MFIKSYREAKNKIQNVLILYLHLSNLREQLCDASTSVKLNALLRQSVMTALSLVHSVRDVLGLSHAKSLLGTRTVKQSSIRIMASNGRNKRSTIRIPVQRSRLVWSIHSAAFNPTHPSPGVGFCNLDAAIAHYGIKRERGAVGVAWHPAASFSFREVCPRAACDLLG